MGPFSSCMPIHVKKGTTTAKLVLEDGRLEEFSTTVKVSQVLKTACFICNADGMNFDEYVYPLRGDDELQVGQLYFELPSYWLKSQLSADQMGSLAVKASKALDVINGGRDHYRGFNRCYWCGLVRRRINDPLEFMCNEGEARPIIARGGGRRLLVDRHTELWVILEEDEDGDQ